MFTHFHKELDLKFQMNILPMILKPIILKFPPANIEPNNCGILAFVKNNFLQFQKTNPYQLH